MDNSLKFLSSHKIEAPNLPQSCLRHIGICIYCGVSSSETHKLTDEHVFPYGIGGDIYLGAASCLACAKDINFFENIAQNRFLGLTKEINGISSRKRRGKKFVKRRQFRLFDVNLVGKGLETMEDLDNSGFQESKKSPGELVDFAIFYESSKK